MPHGIRAAATSPTTVVGMSADLTFPDGFLWGAATAAFQIEGSTTADGRGPSIWDTFAARPGTIEGGDTGDPACDHYRRWDADVDLMTELGLPAYRFSIAWPRVIPGGTGPVNPAGLAFYDRLVDRLLERGITPVVTLYHWDLPQVLQDRGGWLTRASSDWFVGYAAAVTEALGDRVQRWTTLNEPWCSSILSYALGVHAPGHTDPLEGVIAAHHLMLAHGHAVPVIRAAVPGAQVSITLNPSAIWGPPESGERGADAVRRYDNAYNGLFYGPLFDGAYPNTFLDDIAHLTDHSWLHEGDLATIATPLDNLGINNYFPIRVRAGDPAANPTGLPGCEGVVEVAPHPPLTAMGWEVNPGGFREVLLRAATESGLPVYVTENGSAWPGDVVTPYAAAPAAAAGAESAAGPGAKAATGRADGTVRYAVHDPERTAYLRSHLGALREAIDAGADIRGYFAWSLLDNFEWALGYGKRFGIVHVDYDTQVRTIKDSGWEFARIIAAHAARHSR